jgi:ribonuclease T
MSPSSAASSSSSSEQSLLNSKSAAYISVDVETSGPIPGEYSLLSIGACIVRLEDDDAKSSPSSSRFYVELKPVSDNFVQEALDVTGFSMEGLKQNGTDPMLAMKKFDSWIKAITKNGKLKPVFVAYPVAFDWSFINYYFHKYMKFNPFGVSGIDIKSVWMGKTNQKWHKISKESILHDLGITDLEHTHNALDDAIEQSKIFKRILQY